MSETDLMKLDLSRYLRAQLQVIYEALDQRLAPSGGRYPLSP